MIYYIFFLFFLICHNLNILFIQEMYPQVLYLSRYFYNINYLNEEREAMLILDQEILKTKIMNFDFSDENKDPQVSVIYNAGYSLEGERSLRLPESVECRVLAICSSIYYGNKELNELLGLKDKNENKEKKNNSKKEPQEEMFQKTQKAEIGVGSEIRNVLEEYWFK